MIAILRREFSAYFASPIGYVFLVMFYMVTGIPFLINLMSGSVDLSSVFSWTYSILMFIVPILTMRLFSEEKKQKIDQALLTAPVNIRSIVFGKYFAAMGIFLLGVVITIIYAVVLATMASIDWAVVWGSVLGLVLLGAALIAIGMFVSALTENQVIAAVGALAIILVLMMINSFSSIMPGVLQTAVSYISFYTRFAPFAAGTLDVSNVIYFASIAAVFVFLTMRVIEKRRWS